MMNDMSNRFPFGRVLIPLKKMAVVPLLCLTMLACQSVPQANANLSDTGKELLSTTKVVVQNVISFVDVVGHWALESIKTAVQKGYVEGYEDQSFRPEKSVTRAEFVKMVVTALKIPVNGNVSGSEWFLPYVNSAVNAGIHCWSDFTTGDWNTPMTREEMARVAVRAVGEKNDDAKKWMFLATSKGLIQGMDDTGSLGEDKSTNRGQSVTIIERILSVRNGETLPTDKHAISRAEVVWHKTNIFTVMPQFFGKLASGSKWNPDDLFVQTRDGNYRSELDAVYAIDLEDPNDPFLDQVPNLEKLKWANFLVNRDGSNDGFPIKDYKNSFLLFYKGRVVYNNDTSIYSDANPIPYISIVGSDIPDVNAFSKGDLNGIARVMVRNVSDTPALLVPKKVLTRGYFSLEIYAPARAPNPNYAKTLLKAITPMQIQ